MEVRIKCVECICASTCHLTPSCAGTQSAPQSSPAAMGSGNGGRRRMSLEAAIYDSARWRPWCDGRMVIDIGVTVQLCILPGRQSSPV